MPANSESLLGVLTAEAACIDQFATLLEKEQAALTTGDVDDLPEITEQKDALASKLAGLAAQRQAVLGKDGLRGDRSGIDAWTLRHPKDKDATRLWAKIVELAVKARELNRVNGELIALRMQYNSKALEALRGGDQALGLYGSDGQATAAVSRRINDAV